MENVFIYFIKASALIVLFYLAYMLLLRKETFFTTNRWFLLLGLITSTILPLFFISKIVWIEPSIASFDWSNIPVTTSVAAPEPKINWYLMLAYAYFIGIVISFLKLVFDFNSLIKLLKGKTMQKHGNFKLIDIAENIAPFSYFNYIVYNSSLYTAVELENILEHEKVHSLQKHSIDVLISRFFCVIFWFNPLIWLYKKAMVQNLEFIADSEASKHISDKKAYQITLLKITTQENCVAISNHFYQSLIKKRIVMLNKNQSKNSHYWKYFSVLPALIAFVLLFQIEVIAQEKKSDDIEIKHVKIDEINMVITKNTTDAEIKEHCEQIKNLYNIDLTFFNIKRNSNGEIISIKSEFKDNNRSGSSNQSGNTPIKPFKFYYDENKKEMGYNMDINPLSENDQISNFKTNVTTTNEDKIKTPNNKIGQVDDKANIQSVLKQDIDNKPLIVIDGVKQASNFKIEEIPTDQIAKINVLKGINATSKYGESGKNGVIEITIKEKNTNNNNNNDVQSPEIKVVGYGIKEDKVVNGWKVSGFSSLDSSKPLIVVDGKAKDSNFNIEEIPTDQIAKIDVLKGFSATSKYGESGKNGVIEISTKKKIDESDVKPIPQKKG